MNVIEILERQKNLYASREAVVCGDIRLTYKQLYDRIQKLTFAFKKFNLKKGDRIAIIETNCHRYIETYYACGAGGFVAVPINIRLSTLEIQKIIKHSDCSLVLMNEYFYNKIKQNLAQMNSQIIVINKTDRNTDVIDYEELLDSIQIDDGNVFEEQLDYEKDILVHYYTSGSTGEPKGVMLTHHNIMINALMTLYGFALTEDDIWAHAAPQFHVADAWANWAISWIGGKHVILNRFESTQFLRLVEKEKITSSNLVPTMLNSVISNKDISQYDLSSLRFIISGATSLPVEILKKALKLLNCDLYHPYGLTETMFTTLLNPRDIKRAFSENKLEILKSAGRPLPGAIVRIVDQNGKELPTGEYGEIVIEGPSVMKGYWKNKDETEKAIRGRRFYSGDIGYFDKEGYLYVVDRIKDMIITGGENVYSLEIEQLLYTHPNVYEASVIGLPHNKWGEIVVAVIVPKEVQQFNALEIQDFCRKQIAAYKVPKVVIPVDSLPKTGSGKISKPKLREIIINEYEHFVEN